MSYLTERQKEILEFIQGYRRERGIAPTHREICEKFGFSSYGTAYKHLKLLQQKGFLKRDWNQKRGIELIRAIPGAETSERDLPYFGRIAAGGRLWFSALDPDHGRELWTSDGTRPGTRLAVDLAPGPPTSAPEQLTPFAGRLYCAADDGVAGREPWSVALTP